MKTDSKAPTAEKFMRTSVETINPNDTIFDVIKQLTRSEIPNAPVVAGDQKQLLGFISEADCLQFLSNEAYYQLPSLKAKDLMKKHPFCVSPDVGMFALASMFGTTGFRRFPVIDDQHNLVGIVSRKDILVALSDFLSQAIDDESQRRFPPDLREVANHRFIVR